MLLVRSAIRVLTFGACVLASPSLVPAMPTSAPARSTTPGGGGLPHYVTINLSREDAEVLRRAYGIEDPHRLYLSDTDGRPVLKYDTQEKRCAECLVNSYRVGYVSVRQPDETWEEAEHRVLRTPHREFNGPDNIESTSTAALDPEVRPVAEAMLRDARAAGFRVKLNTTYRSPSREAFVMSLGWGRTHTLTSSHSYGRALDVVIGDGRLSHRRTRRDWIAFREWVTHYKTGLPQSFRILGPVNDTWDWPHIELPAPDVGFSSVEEAVARGKECLAPGSKTPCDFVPNLPQRHVVAEAAAR